MATKRAAIRLSELANGLAITGIVGDAAIPIRALAFDSRACTPGALFVALRGGYVDGHVFLTDAAAKGAVAAVIEPGSAHTLPAGLQAVIEVEDTRAALAVLATRFYDAPSRAMTVVGVTGTDGKTTTSHMLEAICRAAGWRTGLIGTVTVRIGDQIDQHESRQTTPESLLVQEYLARMRDAGTDVAVLEATSHGLAMHRLDGCEFDIGVVTNITHEHLDFHGTLENYRSAKGQLFTKVAKARQYGKLGVAVINRDDPGAMDVLRFTEGCEQLFYSSASGDAPVSASDVETIGATTFGLTTPTGSAPVRLNLPGRYNVENALAAAGAAHALGLEVDAIARGLESLRAVPGRMELIDEGQPFQVIIDYAHTPEALRTVLREARRFGTGRLMTLFGSAGERDVAKRTLQGAVAIELADFAIFTSEDPRFEDPEAILEAIAAGASEAGGQAGVHFLCIEDRREAIAALITRAQPGDVLVLAGNGHEHSMIYGAELRPWSDSDVARELLRAASYRRTDAAVERLA